MKRIAFAGLLALSAAGLADQSIYHNGVQGSWVDNWSWASINNSCTSPVHSGTTSIAVTETGTYQAIYFHDNSAQWTTGYQELQFWIDGGASGGQSQLSVQATINAQNQRVGYYLPPLPKNQWMLVTIPLSTLGVGSVNAFDGFWIEDTSGNSQAEWYVDDVSLVSKPSSISSQPIYNGALANSWTNASTAATNFSATSPVYSGTYSVAVTQTHATDVFALDHANLDGSEYQTIVFWINGGPKGGQELQLSAQSQAASSTTFTLPAVALPTLAANTWTEVVVLLQTLGVSTRGDLDGLVISNRATSVPATYYLDAVTLSVNPAVNPLATINVSTAKTTPISPFIYGINSTDWAALGKGYGFTRQGGNRLTAYNWENNASNAGSDYYFENDALMGATNQAGWAVTNFISAALAGNAMPLVTVQMMGYAAADKNPPGNVNQTPDYLSARFKKVKAAKPSGNYVYPPNTEDDFVYTDEFVHYIKQFASPSFPLMFDLDNEPDLWNGTWGEIHANPTTLAPLQTTYSEELSDSIATAAAIKHVYPAGLVFGPVASSWLGCYNLGGAPDAGGRDFLSFYLAGMASASKTAGKRLLDVLDTHWYPQGEAAGPLQYFYTTGDGDSLPLATARLQSPRSLFDSTYVENSWITADVNGEKPLDFIPETQTLINDNYPGTKLSFTEYNFGGANTISGAIAQADVLGIFGRYGVYAAANWFLNSSSTAIVAGYQSFINYDRAGSRFGDLELGVTGATVANNSVYAALDSKNAKRMTLVLINKTVGAQPFTINLSTFTVNSAKGYTISAGVYTTPTSTPVVNLLDAVSVTVPPMSVTTIELLSN